MRAKPPPTRRSFVSAWDEVDYLYHKVLYWFYQREDRPRALPYSRRLEKLLRRADPRQEAIWGQECRALIDELKGDLPQAIRHREQEIRLIKRLQEITANNTNRELLLDRYDLSDLSDRFDLLAMLYYDSGDLDRVLAILDESKSLCDSHGIRFDGKDLLRNNLAEKKSKSSNRPRTNGKNGPVPPSPVRSASTR